MLIKSCPFCGHKLDPDNYIDSIHPTGIYWKEHPESEMRGYFRRSELTSEPDGECWVLSCLTLEGGCGAEMHGDSKQEVIDKWNRRVSGYRLITGTIDFSEQWEKHATKEDIDFIDNQLKQSMKNRGDIC